MATKKFKKLPKDSQRAAFAQMDEDGTRQNKGGKSGGGAVAVRTLKKQSEGIVAVKLPKYDAANVSAANTVYESIKVYNAASPEQKKVLRDQVKADKARLKKEGMSAYYPGATRARNDFLRLTKPSKTRKK